MRCLHRGFPLLSETQVRHLSNGYNYCSRWNSVPSKIHARLEPKKVAIFGNGAFANVISEDEVRWDWSGPQSHDWYSDKRKGHTERDTREDTDRNWSDAPASPGAKDCRAATGSWEKGRNRSPQSLQGRPNLPPLISDSGLLNCEKTHFSFPVTEFAVIWRSSSKKHTYLPTVTQII